MKRWIGLLALPWVVATSTITQGTGCKIVDNKNGSFTLFNCLVTKIVTLRYLGSDFQNCAPDKPEICQDFADALNYFHMKRKEK